MYSNVYDDGILYIICTGVYVTVVLVSARGGFYTALIRKGLRVVSLNMNYCNNQNWWVKRRTQQTQYHQQQTITA